MCSKENIIKYFESHDIHESDEGYFRLKLLPKKKAVEYKKSTGVKLLKRDDTLAVDIVEDNHLKALAIACPLNESSAIFNKRIASIKWLTVDKSLLGLERKAVVDKLLQKCYESWKNKVDMLTILLDMDQYDFLETLQSKGAKVFGGNYTWGCRLDRIDESIFENASLGKVTSFGEDDRPALLECARQSYETYRSHYHADSRLDIDHCTDFFVSVVKKHIDSGGDAVVVKDSDGTISGFSTINPHGDINGYADSNLVAEIAISGVSPKSRGGKVYELTLIKGIECFKERGYRFIVFGCSVDNYVVQSIWTTLGDFRPKRFRYQLHWWF